MDQSQRASEPTPKGSLGDLRGAEIVKPGSTSEAAELNKRNAAAELSMIEELRNSAAFKWFEAEFIDKPYAASFDALRDQVSPQEAAPVLAYRQTRYVAFKSVKTGMIEREIVHLKRVSPSDPAIAALTQYLRTL